MKKLKILLQTPLTERDYKRFGVELLGSLGIEVSFVDLTSLINPKYNNNYQVKKSNFRMVDFIIEEQDFELLVKKCEKEEVLFVDLIGARDSTYFIYKIFKKYRIKYASFCANSIPLLSESLSIRSLLRKIKKGVLSIQQKRYSPSYVLVGGDKYLKKRPFPDKNTKFIWAHTLDYDLYLDYQSSRQDSLIKGGYAVFLDEYFPFHPDFYTTGGMKNPYSVSDEYYSEMNQLFDVIEEKLGNSVVIASHPRSQYEKMPDVYKGRKIIKNKTLNLIANAQCVLAHGSTSINFAVLLEKPLLFLMPLKVKDGYYGKFIINYALQFGKEPLNINSVCDMKIETEMQINERTYSEYKYNYIKKSNSPNKYFWKIVTESVK